MSLKEKKKIKKNLLIQTVFIIAAYIPFLVYLGFRFDIFKISLSRIGWREGGLQYLFFYIFFTVFMLIYQTFLFIKLSSKKSRLLKILIIIGSMLMVVGAAFPIAENSPKYSHFLHSYLCPSGSVLSIISVTIMIALYCKNEKINGKKVAFLYTGLMIFVVASFLVLSTAALFEIGSSVLFLVTILGVNSTLLRNKETKPDSYEPENLMPAA